MDNALPTMAAESRRMLFDDGIYRDAVSQPLYSTVALDNAALPAEIRFFGYGRGQPVPGAGNAAGVAATLWHTNMEIGGQLPKPQKYRCNGVTLHLVPLAFGGANAPGVSDPGFSVAAVSNSDLLDDLLLVANSCGIRLRIGTKLYADHPLMFVPSSYGFGGVAAVALGNTTAGAAPTQQDVGLFSTKGISLDFNTYPFQIDEQQAIEAALLCPWTTPALADDRVLTMVLHGLHYREVS